ncbi:adenylate/guanylate cyclase domain-containing protein [Spirochaeta africana]|uniref:Family 3 adenylate cyclase n=1 Tax=Spirochaeta africana (strain ATCC 700263 / DSM 8902 / Z-7692) TaxID=889378 RepID=H9UII8_SPIAZ|nr:adenylate/guanylate cyclase domain-containing protein [Spirochaeta africana]AFG37331.1 family 3 adenylate cyclase [Spirochaeta africana DSM 8902]
MKLPVLRRCVLLFALLAVLTAGIYAGTPQAQRGVIDLSTWDFDQDGTIELNGEWLFARDEFTDPGVSLEIGSNTPAVEQPQIWNRFEQPLPGLGAATQQLTLHLPESAVGQVLGLRITHIYTAFRLYADTTLIASNGRPSLQQDTAVAQYLPKVAFFQPDSTTVRLTLHISNYDHSKGGLSEPLVLGSDHQILRLRETRIMSEMITVGILGIIGLYHMMIFILRKKELSALTFSLFCVIISLRTLLMGERLWYFFFPNFPWSLGQRMDYLTICLFYPLFVLFLRLIYPQELKKWFSWLIISLSLAFALIVISTPTTFFTRLLTAYNILISISGTYIIYVLILAAVRNRGGARLLLFGGVVFFLTALNDIMYNRGLIQTAYLSNLGLVVFTITQTIVLSYLFTRAYMLIEGINTSLWRFVPQEVLRFLGKNDIVDIQLGDQIHSTFSVLFADIRGFTQLSEDMSPADSFRFINAFLERTGPVIREYGGFIDKYIGDAIMAIFPNDPAQAVQAAIALHREVGRFNHAHPDYPDIRIGVSINSGPIMLGIIGEKERLESTVISDVVNVAARLESLNKFYGTGITISDSVYRRLPPDGFSTRHLGSEMIRGRQQEVAIYEVFDIDDAELRRRKLQGRGAFSAAVAAMQQEQYEEARSILRQLQTDAPLDTVVACLLQRIDASHDNSRLNNLQA